MFYKGSLKLIPGQNYDSLIRPVREIATAGYTVTLNFRFGSYSFMDWKFPEGWANEYQRWYHQAVDPVVQWALFNTGMIRWSEIQSRDIAKIMQKAKRHKLNYGSAHCISAGPGRSLLTAAKSEREFLTDEMDIIHRAFVEIVNQVARGAFLSRKEMEVLTLLASGLRQTEIANRIGVTVGAVRQRTKKALEALDCRTPEQAVAVAAQWGYLDQPQDPPPGD